MLNKIINTIISNIKKYWPVYLIGLLSIVYFSKIIFNSFIPFSSNYYLSDILDLNLPFKSLLADFLQNNSLPLWSNEIATGYPVFAEGQIGSLYPLNILLYKFLPFIFAFKVSFVLHFFLAALFCYLLVRNYKLSKISSLFAALVFACSGFFIGHLGQINVVNAAVWAPLILLLLNLHYRHKKIIYIPLISLFLAIQFLAGHVQISYYTTMCVIIYFFWREIKIWLIFRLPLLKSIKSLALNMLPLLYILILFVLLISVQLLPTYYLANQSWHGNLTMEQNLEFSYHPDNLLTFINPFIYGNPADNTYDKNVDNYGIWSENIGYIGILPLFFAVLGLWSKKKKVLYVSIIIFFLLLILGKYSFIAILFYKYFPFFSYFRLSSRFLLFITLLLSILAAGGLDNFIFRMRALKFTPLIRRGLIIVLVLVSFMDLYLVNIRYNNLNYSQEKYFEKPESAQWFEQDKDMYRIYSFGESALAKVNYYSGGWMNNLNNYYYQNNILQAHYNLIHNIAKAFVYLPLDVYWHARLFDYIRFYEQSIGREDLGAGDKNVERLSKFLGIANVKYFLSSQEINSINFELRKTITNTDGKSSIRIYENKNWQQQFYFVSKAIVVPEKSNSIFTDIDIDFGKEVVLHNVEKLDIPNSNNMTVSKIELVDHSNGKLILNTYIDDSAFLYWSNTFYPGWEAKIDGKFVDIIRANLAFMAIPITAGEHTIEFSYQPRLFYIGRNISVSTLFLVFLFIIYIVIIDRKKIN